MSIRGLMVDPASNNPIVVLRDASDRIFLPIWIGVFEASAIQLELEAIERPRPMTHDLLRNLVEALGSRVEKVVVSDLREQTFVAEIHLSRQGAEPTVVDARPSDALALALRAEAPIYVAQHVLSSAKALQVEPDPEGDTPEAWKKYLEDLDPNDLGDYEM
jgi:bifunctional DNase/RNase